MGLDQFLYKRNASGETEQVMYWRKANFVHRYFTRYFESEYWGDDNCRPFPVTEEELRELSALCDEVLKNKEEAEYILPTMSGFFFGSTDYGDWYFGDVELTKTQIDELLEENPLKEGEEFFYEAWY